MNKNSRGSEEQGPGTSHCEAPRGSMPPYFTVAFIGDIGYFNVYLRQNIQFIKRNKRLKRLVVLGDVFYPRGLETSSDLRLTTFRQHFQDFKCPVNVILGNHDYLGNPTLYPGRSEWEMPNYFYQFRYPTIDLILIDTQQLEPSYTADPKFSNVDYARVETALGPSGSHPLGRDFASIRREHLDWLEKALELSDRKFKVVLGHYHLQSNGTYERNEGLQKLLMPLFRKYRVDAYVSGHEHNIQHHQINDGDYTLHHFIVGSSAGSRRGFKRRFPSFFSLESGHLVMDVKAKCLQFRFVNNQGKTIYRVTIRGQHAPLEPPAGGHTAPQKKANVAPREQSQGLAAFGNKAVLPRLTKKRSFTNKPINLEQRQKTVTANQRKYMLISGGHAGGIASPHSPPAVPGTSARGGGQGGA